MRVNTPSGQSVPAPSFARRIQLHFAAAAPRSPTRHSLLRARIDGVGATAIFGHFTVTDGPQFRMGTSKVLRDSHRISTASGRYIADALFKTPLDCDPDMAQSGIRRWARGQRRRRNNSCANGFGDASLVWDTGDTRILLHCDSVHVDGTTKGSCRLLQKATSV